MRTGAAAGQAGYFHEAVYYASDTEFLAVVVPFLRDGVAAGEPTVASLSEEHAALVRAALPPRDAATVVFQSHEEVYARPASAIRVCRTMLADYIAAGAGQIRIVGEIPSSEFGATWDWWARYESAINSAYDEFPLWSLCAYHAETTPAAVLADVARTHPRVCVPGDEHLPNTDYLEPQRFLTRRTPVAPDPLQLGTPLEITDPTPAGTRAAVTRLNDTVPGGILDGDKLADLHLAATEAVTNGLRHGKPPVIVRCWAGPDRIVVAVTDRGEGPRDPFAGLQAAAHAPHGGVGLWLAHQLCDHVAAHHDTDGFTLRLISGNPYHRV